MNSSDRRKHSCTNFGVIGKGNDQEIEFQKIEIGVFQEIEIIEFIHKIDQDIESLIFHVTESFACCSGDRKNHNG